MIILIFIFLILFGLSCAALAITDEQQYRLLSNGWGNLNNETKLKLENFGDCCGFDNKTRDRKYPCHSQKPLKVQ